MDDPVILGGFSNWLLIDLHLHVDRQDWEETYVELIAERADKRRHLKFLGARNLNIDEGFCGNLSGMCIVDISSRQWGNARIEVRNSEQDPGISLLAWRMEVICGT